MTGPHEDVTRKIIVAITGASGAPYGLRMLTLLRDQPGIETHLIVSRAGAMTLRQECGVSAREAEALADVTYRPADVGATIASGSFPVDAMLVAPCSIKTLSAIAWTYDDDLISRAADVCLKEGRPLLLLVRETPLHLGHLRAMTAAAEAGAIIAPPVPAFYAQPVSIEEMVDHTARRALARVGVSELAPKPWQGEIGGRG
ncbi:UbiX family flavin prenyltransferase [Actinomadura sp. DC4]|uniref:UbiX family flavin prenyltransferase n=1 Tax=Actinomadura sp. DC4 TaxID=3055069 RepID=UPI0025B11232|nr:UbiX family flavin prenyltransferase [Actinomadura sp. DC4]MDN3351217.1 UbiX family flavin prenyltransferase [Actinomadura sp. DC4]